MDDQAVIGENEATRLRFNITQYAEVAQLVERHLAKVDVAGPSPVFRSNDRLGPNNKYAEVAQLVERHLAKVDVAGPSPVFRSIMHH